jgi:hypothetical protein
MAANAQIIESFLNIILYPKFVSGATSILIIRIKFYLLTIQNVTGVVTEYLLLLQVAQ